MRTHTRTHPVPDRAVPTRVVPALVVGGALTFVSGAVVQLVVVPATDVSEDRFSYPWSPGALVLVSALYAVLHVLVAGGLLQVRGRSSRRPVRSGLAVAVVGTLLLLGGEVASIPMRDAAMDDAVVGAVAGVLFGGGTLLSAVGLLVAGVGSLRSRGSDPGVAMLLAGAWTLALLGLIMTPFMALAIGVYGLLLAVLGMSSRSS